MVAAPTPKRVVQKNFTFLSNMLSAKCHVNYFKKFHTFCHALDVSIVQNSKEFRSNWYFKSAEMAQGEKLDSPESV